MELLKWYSPDALVMDESNVPSLIWNQA